MFDKEFVDEQRPAIENLSHWPQLTQTELGFELQKLRLIYSRFHFPRPDGHGNQEMYVVGLHCGHDNSGEKTIFKPLNFWSSLFIFFFDESGFERLESIDTNLEMLNQLLTIGEYFGGFDGIRYHFACL